MSFSPPPSLFLRVKRLRADSPEESLILADSSQNPNKKRLTKERQLYRRVEHTAPPPSAPILDLELNRHSSSARVTGPAAVKRKATKESNRRAQQAVAADEYKQALATLDKMKQDNHMLAYRELINDYIETMPEQEKPKKFAGRAEEEEKDRREEREAADRAADYVYDYYSAIDMDDSSLASSAGGGSGVHDQAVFVYEIDGQSAGWEELLASVDQDQEDSEEDSEDENREGHADNEYPDEDDDYDEDGEGDYEGDYPREDEDQEEEDEELNRGMRRMW